MRKEKREGGKEKLRKDGRKDRKMALVTQERVSRTKFINTLSPSHSPLSRRDRRLWLKGVKFDLTDEWSNGKRGTSSDGQ